MNFQKTFITAALFALVHAGSIAAQTSRRAAPATGRPATPAPSQPAPSTNTAAASSASAAPLAIVNGQTVTLGDIDPKVREAVEGMDKSIADLRQSLLESQINTLLLEAEAKKRNLTVDQLMDKEVKDKLVNPTEDEIKQFYEANKDKMQGADFAAARPEILSYLRDQRGQKLASDLLANLRVSNPVTLGASVTAPSIAPGAVIASVGGKTITGESFNERLKPYLYKLRSEIYEAEADALDVKINNLLLEAEAKKRNVAPADLMKAEVLDKVHKPTDAEIAKFYEENKERMNGATLVQVRADISNYLEQHERAKAELAFAQKLRTGAQIQVLVKEPEVPVQKISVDDDPAKGDASAPVTIVEFTDFQCPACAAMYPVVEDVMKQYAGRVRLVVRDFPLDRHENARKAAEAADAANAQGKFFEYIALLFTHQDALDNAHLKEYAKQIGLDRAKFDADLDSGKYAAEVAHDVDEGDSYMIEGTPTLFINGVRLLDVSPEGLKAAIERALSQPGKAPAAKRTARNP